ncbi:MAG: CPBP family intramembrane glutamic endopeptidase [Thermodesulfobacteriota bacterium]
MSLATCVTMPASTALLLLIVKLRGGPSPADYMAAVDVPLSRILGWVGMTLILGMVASVVSAAVDRPIPEFIISVYEGAYFYPVLWVGLVACAPVYEEVLFRGFMFRGIAASPLGPAGAVVLTAVVWSAAHFQYEHFELGMLIAFGLVLGMARLRTRSLLPCIAMHAVFNLLAAIEAMAALGLAGW